MAEKPDELAHYLDSQGRLTDWPSKRRHRAVQALALIYLIEQFEASRDYTEAEVNDLLNGYHTFDDAALLRRELFESNLLGRERDGSRYWRIQDS